MSPLQTAKSSAVNCQMRPLERAELKKGPRLFDDAGASALFRALVFALKLGAGWTKLRRRTKIAMKMSHC